MTQLFRQNLVEALVGAVVLIIAIVAALIFVQRTSADVGENSYTVAALFENATGVSVGTDVRVSGITVGAVTAQALEQEFPFRARLELSINDRYGLPLDSSASITSEGLLGGTYIALTPGGDPEALRDGDEILDTQGSVDMLALIGQFINNSGDDVEGTAAANDIGGFGNLEDDEDLDALEERLGGGGDTP
ncbi:MAG: outer membrane lipid asymmetry maintenance protein MlaD [Pacificimonas sp.]